MPILIAAAFGCYANWCYSATSPADSTIPGDATEVTPPDEQTASEPAAEDKAVDAGEVVEAMADDEPTGDPRWPGGEPPLIEWQGASPNWVHGQEFTAVAGAKFIGTAECLYCHEDMRDAFVQTAHARSLFDDKVSLDQQGCEACHGAGGAHAMLRSRGAIFAFDWKSPDDTNAICLRCHEWLTTPHEWKDTVHAEAGLKCNQCHDPHVGVNAPHGMLLVEQQDKLCVSCHARAGHDFMKFSHHPVVISGANDPTSGALHCSQCHDVHAGHGPDMLPTKRTQELCLSCHMDKGGPFRFTHMATEEGIGEGCLSCHDAHGSNSAWLHKANGRALCIQCHTDRETHYAAQTCWVSGCHIDMHGSNIHPLFRRP
jgi:DmsE family decaheme c-type cytochrome